MSDITKTEEEPKDWVDELSECFSEEGDFAFHAKNRKRAAQLLAVTVNSVTWERFEEEVRHYLIKTYPDLRERPDEMAVKMQRAESRIKIWLEWD